MALKVVDIVFAPDADPTKHRASIKTDKLDITLILAPFGDFDLAASICKELVQKEGVQAITLCEGFTALGVAKVAEAVGEGIAIGVVRSDIPSMYAAHQIIAKEWF